MLTLDLAPNRFISSAWSDMARLQDDMNRLYSRLQPRNADFPPVNVWTGEESLVVTSELPGVELNNLEISVVGDTLTLRGERAGERLGEGDTYHRRERGYGRFTRTLQLPYRVEADEVSASLRNGVLNITLPRAYAERPRKIEVKAS